MNIINNIFATIATIIIIILFIFALSGHSNESVKQEPTQKEKIQQYIDDCLAKDRRIDQIGNGWTSSYIVCNPK